MNHRIHSLKYLDASLPTLKERTVFALPICRTPLLLSHVKHPLPLCSPLSCQSFLPPPLHWAPGPKLPPEPLCSAAYPTPTGSICTDIATLHQTILLQALAGFFWTKVQIISAQQFTSESPPGRKAYPCKTSQSCQKLAQGDNTYSLLNQLEESQD